MKHRGRHRRRRRGAALRAVLAGTALALTAAATVISTSQAGVAEEPGALAPLTSPADTGRLRLQEHLVPARSLDRLAAAMGRPVGVDAVLRGGEPPTTARRCRSPRPPPAPTAGTRPTPVATGGRPR
jgi:hypothetical protein